MFIALIFWVHYVLGEALMPVLAIIISLAGLMVLLGRIGEKISIKAVNAIFKGIGCICKKMFRAIKWLYRQIPAVFKFFRRFYRKRGCNVRLSRILAYISTAILIAIVI